jgi:hypothetical protein
MSVQVLFQPFFVKLPEKSHEGREHLKQISLCVRDDKKEGWSRGRTIHLLKDFQRYVISTRAARRNLKDEKWQKHISPGRNDGQLLIILYF